MLPASVVDAGFRKEMASRGVVIAGGLGPIAGKAFRLGHMGNIGAGEVVAALTALEATLRASGIPVEKVPPSPRPPRCCRSRRRQL